MSNIFGSFACLNLFIFFLFDSLKEHFGTNLFKILLPLFKSLNNKYKFANLFSRHPHQSSLNILPIQIAHIRQIHLSSHNLSQITIIQKFMGLEYLNIEHVRTMVIHVGKRLSKYQLMTTDKLTILLWYKLLTAYLHSKFAQLVDLLIRII